MLRFTTLITAAAFLPAGLVTAQETITSHGISAFGELKYAADFPYFDYVNPTAPQGGELSFRGFLASQTFDSLNLFILKGEPAQGLERLHDTLLARAFDEPDASYGLIAESLEFPPDRAWVIFNMRPEARFSDGSPITADDVVFSLDIIKAEGSPRYQLPYNDILSAEAIGTNRVRFEFAEGVATRDLIATVGELPILSSAYYADVPFEESTLEPPISSGPFLVDRVDAGRSIRYCKNPDYWAADLPVRVGMHNFDCVRYEYFADNTAAFEAFKVGEYTLHEEFFSALWATNYDFPAINDGQIIRETLEDDRPSGTQGFWLNMRRPFLQDIRVREAIAILFNFEWSNETLFYGLYDRTDSFWENTSMQASGFATGSELALLEPFRSTLPGSVFNEPAYSPPVNSTQQIDRGALRAASALLDEAGWIVGEDGLRRNAEGDVLEIEFIEDNPGFERIVLPFISNLERAGVAAKFELIDSAQMQQRQEEFDFDILAGRLVGLSSPGIELRSVYGSQSAQASGTFNFSGLSDPVIDSLIEEVISAENRTEMETAVRALDRVMRAQHIWVPNWFKGSHWLAYWDIFGRPSEKPAFIRGEDYWWFDQDKFEILQAEGALR